MDKLGFNRQTYNLLERINENLGAIADELERLNENMEDD